MKANILDINGKNMKEIKLPSCFSKEIRGDVILKVLETKKIKQPYSPSPVGGKQHSASGVIRHRRHVWKSQYGRGISRIPRKILSRSGSQFSFVGAEVPLAVGGRRAHPPRVISMINTKKINKKELRNALISAISSTASKNELTKKYYRLNNKKIKDLPLIVESKITSLKTKDLISCLKKILEKDLFEIALKKKNIRPGRGKFRGRRYKKNAGLLLVTGEKEKLKTNLFDVTNSKILNVNDLANGGQGRLTLYTEKAIKELENKFDGERK